MSRPIRPVNRALLVDPSLRDEDIPDAEWKNLNKATYKYLTIRPTQAQAPFDYTWVCKVHEEMLGEVQTYAGQIRKAEVDLGIHSTQISTQLFGLLEDLRYWHEQETFSLLEQAVRLHHRAVVIHPFSDGNGRWSRLLANIWLFQHDERIVNWPPRIRANHPIRDRYIQALEKATEGEFEQLIELHRQFQ